MFVVVGGASALGLYGTYATVLRLCRSVAHITTSVVVVCFEDFDSSGDR